jgi:hypothetical protein
MDREWSTIVVKIETFDVAKNEFCAVSVADSSKSFGGERESELAGMKRREESYFKRNYFLSDGRREKERAASCEEGRKKKKKKSKGECVH